MPGDIQAAIDAAAARVKAAGDAARTVSHVLRTLSDEDPPRVSPRRAFFGGHEWIVDSLPNAPQDVPLLISTTLHHCRAALDNLMWASARAGGASEQNLRRTYFPLLDDERQWAGYTDERGKKHGPPPGMSDVPANIAAILRSVQPFTDASRPVHPLRALRLLSNADKHRFLIPAASAAVGSALSVRVEVGGSLELQPVWVAGRSPVVLTRGALAIGQRAAFALFPGQFDVEGEFVLATDWVWGSDAPEPVRRLSIIFVLVEIIDVIENRIIEPVRAL